MHGFDFTWLLLIFWFAVVLLWLIFDVRICSLGGRLGMFLAGYVIPDWRKAWRFTSVRAAALLALLSMAQADVLPLLQGLVSPRAWPWITLGFSVAIVILRVLAQPALDTEEKPAP